MRYAFINKMRLTYPLPLMCRVLSVSKSGYYAWLTRPPSKRVIENRRLEVEIKASHKRTRGTFGPYRLQRELLSHGIKAGICRIRRIRKNLGIKCRQIRKFKATTGSKHLIYSGKRICLIRTSPLCLLTGSGQVTSPIYSLKKAGYILLPIKISSMGRL